MAGQSFTECPQASTQTADHPAARNLRRTSLLMSPIGNAQHQAHCKGELLKGIPSVIIGICLLKDVFRACRQLLHNWCNTDKYSCAVNIDNSGGLRMSCFTGALILAICICLPRLGTLSFISVAKAHAYFSVCLFCTTCSSMQ